MCTPAIYWPREEAVVRRVLLSTSFAHGLRHISDTPVRYWGPEDTSADAQRGHR